MQSSLSPAQYYAVPAVTRYFDHIQNLNIIRSSNYAPTLVTFDLDNAPKQTRSAEPKKKEKAPKPGADVQAAAAPVKQIGETSKKPTPASAAPAATKGDKPVKDGAAKKEKPAKAAAAPPPVAEDDGTPIPSMIDLRVGRIVAGE